MVALPSILLSSRPYQPTFPTEGRHQALSDSLRTGRRGDRKRSRPRLDCRERPCSVVKLQYELEVVDSTGVYLVDPDD
jgi:hypothetical protein